MIYNLEVVWISSVVVADCYSFYSLVHLHGEKKPLGIKAVLWRFGLFYLSCLESILICMVMPLFMYDNCTTSGCNCALFSTVEINRVHSHRSNSQCPSWIQF